MQTVKYLLVVMIHKLRVQLTLEKLIWLGIGRCMLGNYSKLESRYSQRKPFYSVIIVSGYQTSRSRRTHDHGKIGPTPLS